MCSLFAEQFSGPPPIVVNAVRRSFVKRLRNKAQTKTVDVLSLCCSYQVTLCFVCVCVGGHCYHPTPR